MQFFKTVHRLLTDNSILFFRVVLFFTFTGHGLVSLGFSPGYELHYRIFESVNFFHLPPERFLQIQGTVDLLFAVLILSGIAGRYVLAIVFFYLLTVATAGWIFFMKKTGATFGFAESFRRFAWIFYTVFLWLFYKNGKKYYPLLRYGIAFAFLAHGLASLGFFGLKGAHIELASQVLSEETANKMVFYSGYTDTTLGLLLIFGFFSRPLIAIGSLWLIVVVCLSFMVAFPDGIFRMGFLLSAVYVAVDERCHQDFVLTKIKSIAP
ncbi:MAG: hypothetical protein KIS94_07665 [Chitinophagales bacterium]|nr:hypothetical protein [Chitinophagales bacterium]